MNLITLSICTLLIQTGLIYLIATKKTLVSGELINTLMHIAHLYLESKFGLIRYFFNEKTLKTHERDK